jgi:hypothetical protein
MRTTRRGAVVLEESHVRNAARWHRLATPGEVAALRARLAPRARLLIWPDLSADVDATLAALPDEGLYEIVWQSAQGHISSLTVDDAHDPALTALLAGARAVLAVSCLDDERQPLMAAVLPDPDGVLRARWTP